MCSLNLVSKSGPSGLRTPSRNLGMLIYRRPILRGCPWSGGLRHGQPLPLAPLMPPILPHTEFSLHGLRHISATTADNTEVGTSRLYRAHGHFPNTVDSSYHNRPTRHGGLHTPAWQPYIQHFSTKYYLQSEVRKSLHT